MKDVVIVGNIKTLKETEFLIFELSEKKPKTYIVDVISKCNKCILGQIKWYPSWRYYCFFPNILIETIHSDRCLRDIADFIGKLNKEHNK